jgi:glycosyltransferase involved in cell wall biosynthesis
MKILMISTLNLSLPNGGTVHFTSIAKEFRRAGHTVDAIVPSTGDISKNQIITEKFFDHVTFTPSLTRLIPVGKTSLNSLAQIFSILGQKAHGYDWVYLRSSVISALAISALRLKGFRQIVTEQNGWFADELVQMGVARPWLNLIKQLQLLDAKLATFAIAVVEGIKEKLVEYDLPSEKVLVVGNGTDPKIFYPLPRQEILQKYGLDPNCFYLGLIGDLERWKGAELAIQAMPNICEAYPYVKLLVVGSGRQLGYLQETYRDLQCVNFMNEVPYEQSNEYINCFDIALLPLLEFSNIGFSPIKLYAYAASGKPILSSNFRGVRELESTGFITLHENGNYHDLAKQAIAMISDSQKLAIMGDKARNYAEQHFTWEAIAAKILQRMNQG